MEQVQIGWLNWEQLLKLQAHQALAGFVYSPPGTMTIYSYNGFAMQHTEIALCPTHFQLK
jgi:hypothetical protein